MEKPTKHLAVWLQDAMNLQLQMDMEMECMEVNMAHVQSMVHTALNPMAMCWPQPSHRMLIMVPRK